MRFGYIFIDCKNNCILSYITATKLNFLPKFDLVLELNFGAFIPESLLHFQAKIVDIKLANLPFKYQQESASKPYFLLLYFHEIAPSLAICSARRSLELLLLFPPTATTIEPSELAQHRPTCPAP